MQLLSGVAGVIGNQHEMLIGMPSDFTQENSFSRCGAQPLLVLLGAMSHAQVSGKMT